VPEYSKDVALALLGGSVALAGLLLVIAGFVFTQASSFPPERTSDAVIERYEFAAKLGLIPFVLALCDGALCLCWLLHRSACLYQLSVGGFFLLLLLTAVYGVVLLLKYL
jgi:hypothetical protein